MLSRSLLLALSVLLAATACGTAHPTRDVAIATVVDPAPAVMEPSTAPRTDAAPATTRTTPTPRSPLADLVTEIDSAAYDPADHEPIVPPVWLSIDGIQVATAAVVPVGVTLDGEYEVPPADQVGWYRFGPAPGHAGSAVLAAHIAFDGVDGVFRNLDRVEIGAVVAVGYADGSSAAFEVVERAQYEKSELPVDRVFARTGAPTLTLITCGGEFDRSLSSYEDNVVVYAVPLPA